MALMIGLAISVVQAFRGAGGGPSGSALLLESSGYLLLENGSFLLLE